MRADLCPSRSYRSSKDTPAARSLRPKVCFKSCTRTCGNPAPLPRALPGRVVHRCDRTRPTRSDRGVLLASTRPRRRTAGGWWPTPPLVSRAGPIDGVQINTLADLRDEARGLGKYDAAISAEHKRGQALGYYINRSESGAPGTFTAKTRDEADKQPDWMPSMGPAAQSVGGGTSRRCGVADGMCLARKLICYWHQNVN
jgi:hypothetical protein